MESLILIFALLDGGPGVLEYEGHTASKFDPLLA
jgi:hypothetical protein